MQVSRKKWAAYALTLISTLLFLDLFLGWHRATVSVAGALDVHSSSSAWAGWGAVGGLLLIVLVFWEALRMWGAVLAEDLSGSIVSLTLAVGAAACIAIEFFAGTASVQVGSVVMVGVHGRQWPAYLGLVLAAFLVAAAVVQFGRQAEHHAGRLGLGVR
jgi:hypothetical protein